MKSLLFLCALVGLASCTQPVRQSLQVDPQLRQILELELDYQRQLAQAPPSRQRQIKADYQSRLREIAPSPEAALQLPGVAYGDEEHLVLDGDMLVSPYTFRGAVEVWLLNQQARGSSLSAVNAQLTRLGSTMPTTRGVYQTGVSRWPGNRVYYKLSSGVSEEERKWIEKAMLTWQRASEDELTFWSVDEGVPNQLVTILVEDGGKEGVLGWAHVGAHVSGEIHIYPHEIEKASENLGSPYEAVFQATVLHELGHSLGLYHEHQRWDRDTYLESNQQNTTEGRILPLFAFYPEWQAFQYGQVTVDLPVGTVEPRSCTPTAYDYRSIMHYSGRSYRAKQNHQGYLRGETITFNYQLSEGDKRTVQQLYSEQADCR